MAAVNPISKEKAAQELKPIYDQLSEKFGRMPNFFAIMAHRPNALKHFLTFYASVMAAGTIEAKYKELAYLKASRLNGCEYETRAHAAAAKKAGLTEEQIREMDYFHRSHAFDEKEKSILLYAERMTRGAAPMRERTLQEMRKHLSEDQIVELTLVVATANFSNRFNDALQIEPDLGDRSGG
jgi:uncharacterized peroxidase-related enzyme